VRIHGLHPLVLLAPLLVALSLRALVSEPASIGRPRACARAQLIDGELRCDEELLDQLRALCPAADERVIGPGDAVDACTVARMPPDQLAALGQPVDINTASLDELASLPGIGPTLAARIVSSRPFSSIDELDDVSGIGPAKLRALRPRARVSQSR
jgi:DNA uptake protein ComE-like DNA-binding protein